MIKLSELLLISYEAVTVYDFLNKEMFHTSNLTRQDASRLVTAIPTATVNAIAGRVTDRHLCELIIWTNETMEDLEKEKIEYDIKKYEEKKKREDHQKELRRKRLQARKDSERSQGDSQGK